MTTSTHSYSASEEERAEGEPDTGGQAPDVSGGGDVSEGALPAAAPAASQDNATAPDSDVEKGGDRVQEGDGSAPGHAQESLLDPPARPPAIEAPPAAAAPAAPQQAAAPTDAPKPSPAAAGPPQVTREGW